MTTKAKASEPKSEEAPQTDSKESTAKKTVKIVYRGRADSFEHGEHQFRPDQPVSVPSDVAEELLTYPYEKFEEAKE